MATGGTAKGFKLVTPDREVGCANGADVTLRCRLSAETSAVAMEIRWFKWTDVVYLYKNGDVIEGRGYEGRVSVDPQQLQRGDVSLTLRRTRFEDDKGVYTCLVISDGHQEETRVGLVIKRAKADWMDAFEKDRMKRTLQREIAGGDMEKMGEAVRSVAPPAWWKASEELMKKNKQLEEKKKTMETKLEEDTTTEETKLEEDTTTEDTKQEEDPITLQEEDEQLQEKDLRTQLQEKELEERYKQLKEKHKQLEEKHKQLEKKHKKLEEEKDRQLEERDKKLEEKHKQLEEERGKQLKEEKDRQLEEEKDRQLEERCKQLEEKDKQLEDEEIDGDDLDPSGIRRTRSEEEPLGLGGESPGPAPPVPPAVSELRLVLLGGSAAGKRAAGNTILGTHTLTHTSTETQHSEIRQGEVAGRQVTVVDTTDWFFSGLSEKDMRQNVGLCVRLSAPGPHAFLLVIPVESSEGQERRMLNKMEDIFGEGCWEHTLILFTHAERLKEKSAEELVQTGSQELKQLVEKCGNRCHLLSVKDTPEETQITQLLEKIEKMVLGNRERFYSSKAYQVAERQCTDLERRIQKEWREMMDRKEREMKSKHEQELEISINKVKGEIQEKDMKISALEGKITKLEKELNDINEINEKNEDKRKEFERQLKEENEKLRVAETEREKLKEKFEKQKKEIEDTHKEEEKEIMRVAEMKKERLKEKFEKQIKTFEGKITKLEEELDKINELDKQNEEKRRELERQLNEEKEEKRVAKMEKDRLKEKFEKQKKDIDDTHKGEIKEMRESYEREAMAEAERILMRVLLPELQRDFLTQQEEMKATLIRQYSSEIKYLRQDLRMKERILNDLKESRGYGEKSTELEKLLLEQVDLEREIGRMRDILYEKDKEMERMRRKHERELQESEISTK